MKKNLLARLALVGLISMSTGNVLAMRFMPSYVDEAIEEKLASAARRGDLAMVESLLAGGSYITETGAEALLCVAEFGNVEVVQFVLKQYGDSARSIVLNHSNFVGSTVLMCAANGGKPDVVRLILSQFSNQIERRAAVKLKGSLLHKPLMRAVMSGNHEVVQLILDQYANDDERRLAVNHKDGAGRLPLMGAMIKGKPEIVRILLAYGADIGAVYAGYGPLATGLPGQEEDPEVTKVIQAHKDRRLQAILLCEAWTKMEEDDETSGDC